MHAAISANQERIREICQRFHVKRLEAFGSASTGAFDAERSDFDFMVEFDLRNDVNVFDAYFGLKEALEELLGRRVDLVMPSALRNPYFRASVERQLQPVYGGARS
jgi:predicted nucleotidyltransferase